MPKIQFVCAMPWVFSEVITQIVEFLLGLSKLWLKLRTASLMEQEAKISVIHQTWMSSAIFMLPQVLKCIVSCSNIFNLGHIIIYS